MNEIIRLHEMLNEANIPHTFTNHMSCLGFNNGYQIVVRKDDVILCDAVYTIVSYGHEKGLLEIAGALTEKEKKIDGVLGYLTAEEVFKRFKYCYENNTSLYKR